MSRYCQACGEPMENHKPHPMGHEMKPPSGLRSRATSRPGISLKVCPIRPLSEKELDKREPKDKRTTPIYVPARKRSKAEKRRRR